MMKETNSFEPGCSHRNRTRSAQRPHTIRLRTAYRSAASTDVATQLGSANSLKQAAVAAAVKDYRFRALCCEPLARELRNSALSRALLASVMCRTRGRCRMTGG